MAMNDLVLVHGMDATKRTLRRYNERPVPTLVPWFLLSLLITVLLLTSVWVVAKLTPADITAIPINGVSYRPDLGDYAHIMFRNLLVLALHALACVAGFMAGSSMPLLAENRSGIDRWVHEKAGPAAIAFVTVATLFSLCTQSYYLGGLASQIAGQLDMPPALLVVGLLPHALPELVVLFLPLAAWLIASRKSRWDELLAATAVCVVIAVPVLLATAAVELWVSPHLVTYLAGLS
jgi:hypothetical protein